MNIRRSTRTRPKRSFSSDAAVTRPQELTLQAIESLILRLARLATEPEVREVYWQQYHGFANQHRDRNGNHLTIDEYTDIIDALQALLDATKPDSSTVVEVHTTIGNIYQKLNIQNKAAESFLKALWVEIHSHINDVETTTRRRLSGSTPPVSRGAA